MIAKFMGQVAQIFVDLLRQSTTGKCFCDTRALELQRVGNLWRIELEGRNDRASRRIIYAEHVIIALGAVQEPPRLDQRHHQAKVICSNEALSAGGLQKVHTKLAAKHGKICIVGGAHSAFSVAWLCLRADDVKLSKILVRQPR